MSNFAGYFAVGAISALAGFAAGFYVRSRITDDEIADLTEINPEDFGRDGESYYEYKNAASLNDIPEKLMDRMESITNNYKSMNDIPEKEPLETYVSKYESPEVLEHVEDEPIKAIGKADYEAGSVFGKLTATFFTKDKILAGYNDDLDEQNGTDRGEFIVDYILSHPGKDEFHFRDFVDVKDIYVMISDQSFDDAYAEFVEKEAASYVETASKEE